MQKKRVCLLLSDLINNLSTLLIRFLDHFLDLPEKIFNQSSHLSILRLILLLFRMFHPCSSLPLPITFIKIAGYLKQELLKLTFFKTNRTLSLLYPFHTANSMFIHLHLLYKTINNYYKTINILLIHLHVKLYIT